MTVSRILALLLRHPGDLRVIVAFAIPDGSGVAATDAGTVAELVDEYTGLPAQQPIGLVLDIEGVGEYRVTPTERPAFDPLPAAAALIAKNPAAYPRQGNVVILTAELIP